MINSSPQIQVRQILDIVYPIGIIVEFASNVNPNDIMQGQVWELYGEGKTTVCKNSGTFATLGGSVGAETHTLTVNQMPNHNHSLLTPSDGITTEYWSANVCSGNMGKHTCRYPGFVDGSHTDKGQQYLQNSRAEPLMNWVGGEGGNQAHNNIQPSIVVLRYRRIA